MVMRTWIRWDVSLRHRSPLSEAAGVPSRIKPVHLHSSAMWKRRSVVFSQSADFTPTHNDKQEQERAEKYFIRASVEAVTTQIHPPLSVSSNTHTQTESAWSGVCVLERRSCQMWGFGRRTGECWGEGGGGGCQKLQTRTDRSRVTTNIYLGPTRVLPPVRSRVLVHALTTANRKHTAAFSKAKKRAKSFTAHCCCCWKPAQQLLQMKPLHHCTYIHIQHLERRRRVKPELPPPVLRKSFLFLWTRLLTPNTRN